MEGSLWSKSRKGKKIFIGRLPQEASVEDLRLYFGRFGRILDVYIPKDPKRSGHRGFGFVTFADDGVADRVSRRSHEICGQQVAIDSATPVDDGGSSGGSHYLDNPPEPSYGGYGPMQAYGRMYGSLDFDDLLAKNAHFKQIWKSRKGTDTGASDDALHDMCRLYDVERVDVGETNAVHEQD